MDTILHGCDYNPEQWLRHPGVIDEDFRLFTPAHINSVSLGIFAWAMLEPEEGRYQFDWMDAIFDRAAKQGLRIILATPSGGKPNWLALSYPEVRRVSKEGVRDPQRGRHNHCLTSPVYRRKVREINARLAGRYGSHLALAAWHVSNEYGGYCYCELCMAAFRDWLQARYGTLDALNDAYWARFWSHAYTAWDQIQCIDPTVDGLAVDWKRFMTHQCRTFIHNEAEPIRQACPNVPVTTNFMPAAFDYNYWELAKELDLISWDSYPKWHGTGADFDETETALAVAFHHDLFRSMKGGAPFLLMETTPSQVNWADISPLRRPGVHRLNGLQAIAHGSDSVCYFQWRKSRGSKEQWHGAVIDHVGHERTRVFNEVAALGSTLEKISGVAGSRVPARAALLFDWEVHWAIEQASSPQNRHKEYFTTVREHYRPFWNRGIAMDVIDSETGIEGYQLVIAPMLYLLRDGQAERLTRFVQNGGTLVMTYQTGCVNATTLAITGGVPGPLRKLLGVWVEEFDALPDTFRRKVVPMPGAGHGLSGTYEARHYLDLIHAETAEVLAAYGDDFYAGRPALTLNRFGKGRAYYVASRNDPRFQDDFLGSLAAELALPRALAAPLPHGVTAHRRTDGHRQFLFLLNFTATPATVELGSEALTDLETGHAVSGPLTLAAFGSRVFVTRSAPLPQPPLTHPQT